MVCRHKAGDTSCSSHPDNVRLAQYEQEEASRQKIVEDEKRRKLIKDGTTPDASNYEILEAEQVGKHFVMKVLYPNCAMCAYEGVKIMVFLNVFAIDVLRWKKIDPHFRQSSTRMIRDAPSPAARFPNSKDGWADAITYAKGKN